MSAMPVYVWVIVLIGLIGTTATVGVMLWGGARATGHRRGTAAAITGATGIIWGAWVLISAWLGYSEVYRFASTRPQPWLPAAVVFPLAVVLLATRVPVVSGILE
ncbi:MAG: hypothetical protein JO152_02820, partial [Mycobacteriaceae bacterium]|nr:hypothetical protein [Mycobacteriaceae bacterium]